MFLSIATCAGVVRSRTEVAGGGQRRQTVARDSALLPTLAFPPPTRA
jgi:hypothetical protein